MAKIGNLGSWAFLIAVALAVILGAIGQINQIWTWIFIVIGIIAGLLNIADKETTPFLLSGVVLIIASGLGQNALSDVAILDSILKALLIIFVPATVIVALKNVFSLARR